MAPLASGSDFGGSLRTPAGFCGVVGFRPSPGVVPSETRPVALTPLSVYGPMGRTVSDAALLLAAQADSDIRDPFSSAFNTELIEPIVPQDLSNVRIAVSTNLGCAPVDNDIASVFKKKVETFRHVFASAEDVDPELGEVHKSFEILRGVNFVAAHGERVKNEIDLLGPNVIDNVRRGLEFSLEDVAWAHNEQTKMYRQMLKFYSKVDILICPTSAVSPYPHEQLAVEKINGEKMPTYMRWLALSYGLTMTLPAVCSINIGLDHKGMPFGIQVAGPNGADCFVLSVALALEQYLRKSPELSRPSPDIEKLKKPA
jgi:Asp-tRNA(Asn)/Glu-tRNA(Gln) amidotransferase A subunit family amidase